MLRPKQLRCEYLVDPIGTDIISPRLFWTLEAAEREQAQSAYQVIVSDSPEAVAAGRGNAWDSGRVASGRSTHIVYEGRPLRSNTRYWWAVRVWDQAGESSGYSEPAFWQMGLLDDAEWQAEWISYETGPGNEMGMAPAAYLRREFRVEQPLARATLHVTARGLYRLRINGAAVGEAVLAPDWTDYDERILYDSYDVTALLREGANAVGAILGDGWYAGYVGYEGKRNHYGEQPQLLLQLHLEAEDGSRALLCSDGQWKGAAGPIRYSDLLHGEHYDARLEMPGWDRPGFDEARWHAVSTGGEPATLHAQLAEPVVVAERLPARSISEPEPGVYLFDLGQNFAGWARLTVEGEPGREVQLRFGEILNADGTLYTENLRRARATDTYILKGEGEEVWEPHFTYHGFRYVEVRGFPGKPSLEAITGCVVHSKLPWVGEFHTSNPLVNQLWRNIGWGQRSNFVSIPTDCPQRDERLGWTGDVVVFGRTACLNMDAAAFFSRWMLSVEDAQTAEGAFPDVAPLLSATHQGAPAWGDAGIIVPWTLYQLYGDTRVIERHYEAMTRWMHFIREENPGYLRARGTGRNYGDWVSYNADTPRDLLATAFWAYDARLMAEMSRAIGREEEAARYERLFERVREAFIEAYVSEDGRVKGETQTAYVLALHMDLLPADLRAAAARHLVADIEARGYHLSTGFIGTSFLLPVLTEAGYGEVAYRLLTNDSCPSWGYMIRCGATTIWERWDSLTDAHTVFDPEHPTFLHPTMGPVAGMNSFNHYAFGAVGEWLYRYVAGIDLDPEQPAYRHIRIRPTPGDGITEVRARYDSIHGPITSAWKSERGTFRLDVSIPANTTATVVLPVAGGEGIVEGGQPLEAARGVHDVTHQEGQVVVTIGSGSYSFIVPLAEGVPAIQKGGAG